MSNPEKTNVNASILSWINLDRALKLTILLAAIGSLEASVRSILDHDDRRIPKEILQSMARGQKEIEGKIQQSLPDLCAGIEYLYNSERASVRCQDEAIVLDLKSTKNPDSFFAAKFNLENSTGQWQCVSFGVGYIPPSFCNLRGDAGR